MSTSDATTPAEAIATALTRLRGRRGPRGPWGDPSERGGPHGEHGGMHGGHGGLHGPHGPWAHGGGPRFGGPARLRLIEALAQASEPLSVSELAERIGVDQPRASRLVQQGVELGLVRREADPADARRTRIVLTDEGRTAARGFRGERIEAVRTALADFSDADAAELARLLTRFAQAWPQR
ncbi:MarR family winged helix-turn-helix transcriptional regulator [Microbacterium sp. zg-YB36]|uniref:MarR family winged helix-turn-helix transcriptional regulator n=1 Tax=Microbacterium sp. zg-YB36 TaxID=2969407 RepID=UPI00214C9CEE|nr:MarR family winged helix-turn-helix transcriptional regulator [Microbacterium sp. zg-YB36]MDL5352065.1 MarR family winged helix-turn-helix transcriptional regulator [Microbacterium sp. zg-YB36]